MKESPLKTILALRKLRTDIAMARLATEKQRLDEANALLLKNQEALKGYVDYKNHTEDRLYGGLVGQNVSVSRLHRIQTSIKAMNEDRINFENEVHASRESRDTADLECRNAQGAYKQALVSQKKISCQESKLCRERALEQERKDEDRLDETALNQFIQRK